MRTDVSTTTAAAAAAAAAASIRMLATCFRAHAHLPTYLPTYLQGHVYVPFNDLR